MKTIGKIIAICLVVSLNANVRAEFHRNSTAVGLDGTEAGKNIPRFGKGISGEAVLLEKRTENLVGNSSFEASQSNEWDIIGKLEVSQSGEKAFHGNKGVQINALDTGDFIFKINTIPKAIYSLSIKIFSEKEPTEEDCQLIVNGEAESTFFRKMEKAPWYSAELGLGGIYGDDKAGTFGIRVPKGRRIYIDAVQIEKGNHSTTYIPAERTDESLAFRLGEGNNLKNDGTISLWVLTISAVADRDCMGQFIYLGNGFGGAHSFPRVEIMRMNSASSNANGLQVDMFNSHKAYLYWINLKGIAWRTEWQHIVFTWEQAGAKTLYLNGNVARKVEDNKLLDAGFTTLLVGENSANGIHRAEAFVDELLILDKALSASEIYDLHKHNKNGVAFKRTPLYDFLKNNIIIYESFDDN